MRESRTQATMQGSLRGLPSITYYNVQRLKPKNLIIQAAKYLPSNIWTKLDRRKPLNARQEAMVRRAINKAAIDLVRGYPLDVPIITMTSRRSYSSKTGQEFPNKRLCILKSMKLFSFRKESTEYGTVYCLYEKDDKKREIEFDRKRGQLGFSSHVFDRLFERIPGLDKIARHEDCSAILKILHKAIRDDIILTVDETPMLQAFPSGFFPLLFSERKSLWVCKTYLEAEMDGTPKLDEDLARILKKIVDK